MMEANKGNVAILKAPFPWFGGKSQVAPLVWERFGAVYNYVEPFFGSGAVLLGRPHPAGIETVNDKDGYVANFWRALQAEPEQVAVYADTPVNENDLHARHLWLVRQKSSLVSRLEGDPDYYDAKIAGWWVWGISCWIGDGFCSGKGPWTSMNGHLVKQAAAGTGIRHQLPHLGTTGMGIHRKRPHLMNAGRGIHRNQIQRDISAYLQQLAHRLRRVRVTCGDWSRVCGPSVTLQKSKEGFSVGIFLDPPYSLDLRDDVYNEDMAGIASDVQAWCREWGQHPRLRVALCGYAGEHECLEGEGWTVHAWSARGYASLGNGRGKINRHAERIWFSPHCLNGNHGQPGLWDDIGDTHNA